jgi:hypothetical protein
MVIFETLLRQFNEIPKFDRNTNYFEITGHSHYENIVSNILKFYLDPNNDHGFEDLVLRSLLEISIKDFLIGGFNSVEIIREEYTENGKRIDLVIETENYIIAVENKIFHKLNNDLNEYEEHIIKKVSNGEEIINQSKTILLLVLSLNPIKKGDDKLILENSSFENITYKEFIKQIKKNYNTYAFTANTKYLIFFNEFISSFEKLLGINMKDEKLKEFFLSNTDGLEELVSRYTRFKNEFIKDQLLILKEKIEGNFNNVKKSWIYQGYILVQDFNFGDHKIVIDTIATMNGFKITIFGRDKLSHDYLRSDKFYQLTKIDKSLKPEIGKRLEYPIIKLNKTNEAIFNKLKSVLSKVNEGNEQYNLKN